MESIAGKIETTAFFNRILSEEKYRENFSIKINLFHDDNLGILQSKIIFFTRGTYDRTRTR